MMMKVTGSLAMMALAQGSPIAKVEKMLKDMQSEKQEEGEKEELANKKMECWCKKNDEEKSNFINTASDKHAEALATIKSNKAAAAEAAQNMADAKDKMEELTGTLKTKQAINKKETDKFNEDTQLLRENIAGLGKALDALKQFNPDAASVVAADTAATKARTDRVRGAVATNEQNAKDAYAPKLALAEVREIVQNLKQSPYTKQLNTDLLEVFAAFPTEKAQLRGDKLALVAGPEKSYSSASGQVFGMLTQMHERMSKDLKTQQDEEDKRVANYNNQMSNLRRQFADQKEFFNTKAKLKADSEKAAADARTEAGEVMDQLDDAKAFLAQLTTTCKDHTGMYNANVKARAQELKALGTALGVLNEDSVRDLFLNPPSFMQVSAHNSRQLRASKVLKASGLALLAAKTEKIDSSGMDKVFAAFDKMSTQLKAQLQEESDKRDMCNKHLHQNSMDLLETKNTIDALKRSIAKAEQDKAAKQQAIKDGKEQVQDMYENIQRASMDRADENHEYQAAQDNGNKIAFVLKKVYTTLESQYASKPKSFIQAPGDAVFGDNAPPVAALKKHENSPAGGVLAMMQEIMADNKADLTIGIKDENHKQAAYENMLKSSFGSVKNLQKKIVSDQKSSADLGSALEEQGEQKSNQVEEFMDLGKEKSSLHSECDFLIKNFDFRQEKIKDEVEAISDAKAILSGADM